MHFQRRMWWIFEHVSECFYSENGYTGCKAAEKRVGPLINNVPVLNYLPKPRRHEDTKLRRKVKGYKGLK